MGRIFIVDEPVEDLDEDLDKELDDVERKLIRREAQWFDEDRYGYTPIHSNYIPFLRQEKKHMNLIHFFPRYCERIYEYPR